MSKTWPFLRFVAGRLGGIARLVPNPETSCAETVPAAAAAAAAISALSSVSLPSSSLLSRPFDPRAQRSLQNNRQDEVLQRIHRRSLRPHRYRKVAPQARAKDTGRRFAQCTRQEPFEFLHHTGQKHPRARTRRSLTKPSRSVSEASPRTAPAKRSKQPSLTHLCSGKSLTITAKGRFNEDIAEGAKIHLQVKYGLITIIRQTADLCDTVKNVDLECPLEKGARTLTKDVDLPNQIPPGKYTVLADVVTKDEEKITCLTATVTFKRGGEIVVG